MAKLGVQAQLTRTKGTLTYYLKQTLTTKDIKVYLLKNPEN